MDAALYRDGKRLPDPFVLDGARHLCDDPNTFAWIGLYEPTEEEFEAVTKEFDLHELAVEDAIHAHQRPKLDVYDDTLFVVLKPARYVDPVEVVELGEILLFVDERFVVAVRHGEASKLVAVRKALEDQPEELSNGSSAVLLAILDRVVDDYAAVLDGLEGDIRELEDEVFSETGSTPTQRIYKLKREVLQFHQATAPLVEPILLAGQPTVSGRQPRASQVLQRRPRPSRAGGREDHRIPRPAHVDPRSQPHSGERPAEQRHAQDLGLGGDRRRPHRHGRDLGDELRSTCPRSSEAWGYPLALVLMVVGLWDPVSKVQEVGLAMTGGNR